MAHHRRLIAAVLLLVSAAPAFAETFVENFDDGTVDPLLNEAQFNSAVHFNAADGVLHYTAVNSGDGGDLTLYSDFSFTGDFTVTAIVHIDAPGPTTQLAALGVGVDLFGLGTYVRAEYGNGKLDGKAAGASGEVVVAPPLTVTMRVRRTGSDFFAEYSDNGTDFTVLAQKLGVTNGATAKVNDAYLTVFHPIGGTNAHTGYFDDFTINAGDLEIGPAATATPTPVKTTGPPTPTPRPSPVNLDHVMSYGVKATKGEAPFVPIGPVALAGQLGSGAFDVVKVAALLLPAAKNGGGVHDSATHLLAYAVKPSKGSPKPVPPADVHVVNQCSDVTLAVKKPVSLLVPTAKDLGSPIAAPANPALDHFLCYGAKPTTKLPKGTQVDVQDQFQSRRYDLPKITKLCVPVGKSGTPSFLKGDAKGQPATIAPASIQHPDSLLVCYAAKLATKSIPQAGCGAVDPKAKGTKLATKQPKHAPHPGMFVNNQLGPLRLDSTKELELCVPTLAP